MYPDQQQQYSIDYLNQIAPQGPKRRGFSRLQWILIGSGLFLICITLVALLVGGVGTSTKTLNQQLAARLITTEQIVSNAQKTIKSSELRTLNSSLNLYLTNANRDIVEPLAVNGIETAKLDKSIVAEEDGQELIDTLEDARLNADYDRRYAREMAYQLETIVNLMREIDAKTNSDSLKSFIDTSYTNLEPLQRQFADFNAANG